MISKGNQRGGGQQLATHLLNARTNEHVDVVEVSGAVAQDLHGALSEWEATSQCTKCKQYLYSLSINPDPAQGPLTKQQYLDYIIRAEQKLGLKDQPRAVVFHVKDGREHCHVVWSRIDTENMKAVHMSHDRQKLRTVTRAFAKEHGLELPEGMKDKGLDRFNEQAKRSDLAEKQQQERTGISKNERVEDITAAWRESDSGKAFFQALEQRGYFLARGDRRAYVVVDRFAEIHSLPRQIKGIKTKDVKERLKDYPLEKLPHASKAQEYARQQRVKTHGEHREEFNQPSNHQHLQLKQAQDQRRKPLIQEKAELQERQAKEEKALIGAQAAKNRQILTERYQNRPQGLAAFLGRVTGIQAIIDYRHRKQDEKREEIHLKEQKELEQRHKLQTKDLNRQFTALDKIDKREISSLKTSIRVMERPAGRQPVLPRELSKSQRNERTKQKWLEFMENSADLQEERTGAQSKKEEIRDSADSATTDDSKESLDEKNERKRQEVLDRRKTRGRGNDLGRKM